MGKLLQMQASLLHVATAKDVVYTPPELALDMVDYFLSPGSVLDPCRGEGAFYKRLPRREREWCEIEEGRDFYAWTKPVNTIIGNPPYSHLLAWIRHSFKLARNIIYLIPPHRVFASAEFLNELLAWGGVRHIRLYGTGTDWGFPFGHALAAVYYHAGWRGGTEWSQYLPAAQPDGAEGETK